MSTASPSSAITDLAVALGLPADASAEAVAAAALTQIRLGRELYRGGARLRNAQLEYFAARTPDNLARAKAFERDFDGILRAWLASPQPLADHSGTSAPAPTAAVPVGQVSLFGGGGR